MRVCVAGWLVGWSVLVSGVRAPVERAVVCAFVRVCVRVFVSCGLFACVLSWVEILNTSTTRPMQEAARGREGSPVTVKE